MWPYCWLLFVMAAVIPESVRKTTENISVTERGCGILQCAFFGPWVCLPVCLSVCLFIFLPVWPVSIQMMGGERHLKAMLMAFDITIVLEIKDPINPPHNITYYFITHMPSMHIAHYYSVYSVRQRHLNSKWLFCAWCAARLHCAFAYSTLSVAGTCALLRLFVVC